MPLLLIRSFAFERQCTTMPMLLVLRHSLCNVVLALQYLKPSPGEAARLAAQASATPMEYCTTL